MSILLLLAVTVGFVPAKVCAQGASSLLGDLGSRKNGPDELANSLVGAPRKYGKGEKKEEIKADQLKSKSIKDTTFGGSVLNAGITGSEPKLDEKVHGPTVAKDTHVSEHPAAHKEESKASGQSQITEKEPSFLDLSETARLAQELDDSGDVSNGQIKTTTNVATSGEAQKKNQTESTTATATAPGEKTSTSSTQKSSGPTPDGDH